MGGLLSSCRDVGFLTPRQHDGHQIAYVESGSIRMNVPRSQGGIDKVSSDSASEIRQNHFLHSLWAKITRPAEVQGQGLCKSLNSGRHDLLGPMERLIRIAL